MFHPEKAVYYHALAEIRCGLRFSRELTPQEYSDKLKMGA